MAWQQQSASSQSRGHWWPSSTTPSQQEASWLVPSQRKREDIGIVPKSTTHGCLETFENYIENSNFYEESSMGETSFKSAFSQSQWCCHCRVPASQKSCRPLQITFQPGGFKVFAGSGSKEGPVPISESFQRIKNHPAQQYFHKRRKRKTEGKCGEGKEWNSCRTVPPWHLITEPDEGSNLSP